MKSCDRCGAQWPDDVTPCGKCGGIRFSMLDAPAQPEIVLGGGLGSGLNAGGGQAETVTEITPQSNSVRDDLVRLKKDYGFSIGLIGLGATGKTWFLNRLKHSFRSPDHTGRRSYLIDPEPDDDGSVVGVTTAISTHGFGQLGTSKGRFGMVDVPGELVGRAADKGFREIPRDLLHALQICDAFIFVLPADELFLAHRLTRVERREILRAIAKGEVHPEELNYGRPPPAELNRRVLEEQLHALRGKKPRAARDKKLIAEQIEGLERDLAAFPEWGRAFKANEITQFLENLKWLAAVLSLFDHGLGVDEVAAMDPRAIHQHATSERFSPRKAPIFFAISKADQLFEPSEALIAEMAAAGLDKDEFEDIDADPLGAASELCDGFDGILEIFPWCKVDFVTAFNGHDGSTTIKYRKYPPIGVEAVIRWMQWAQDVSSRKALFAWESETAKAIRDIRERDARRDRRYGGGRFAG